MINLAYSKCLSDFEVNVCKNKYSKQGKGVLNFKYIDSNTTPLLRFPKTWQNRLMMLYVWYILRRVLIIFEFSFDVIYMKGYSLSYV